MQFSVKVVAVVGLILLSACASKDEQYYRLHPAALQEQLKQCPASPPGHGVSCRKLVEIAAEVNQLAYALQVDPQGFGQTILTLQTNLAVQEKMLAANPQQEAVQLKVKEIKQQIAMDWAVVKWLESPEK